MNIDNGIDELIKTLQTVKTDLKPQITALAEKCCSTLDAGNKILVMGNGGSAADSQHFVAELVSKFKTIRKALPAISLTTNTSILTAIGNDFTFDDVFDRQVQALARNGDLVIGISTSGNSGNVIKAIKTSRQMGCYTVCLLGNEGGKLKDAADLTVIIPSKNTPRIQECHIHIIHAVCEAIDEHYKNA